MEDALVRFNNKIKAALSAVLILVLMEDALVLLMSRCRERYVKVLILVLMEDALVPHHRTFLEIMFVES